MRETQQHMFSYEVQDRMFPITAEPTQADKEFEYENNVDYFDDPELNEVYRPLKNINKGLPGPYNTNQR